MACLPKHCMSLPAMFRRHDMGASPQSRSVTLSATAIVRYDEQGRARIVSRPDKQQIALSATAIADQTFHDAREGPPGWSTAHSRLIARDSSRETLLVILSDCSRASRSNPWGRATRVAREKDKYVLSAALARQRPVHSAWAVLPPDTPARDNLSRPKRDPSLMTGPAFLD